MQRLGYPAIRPVFTPTAPPLVPRVRQRSPRCGIPFFRDPTHTIPTKWSLYRPLLQSLGGFKALRALKEDGSIPPARNPQPRADAETPSHDDILPALRARWRKGRANTSIPRARIFIESEEALLSALEGSSTSATAPFAATAFAQLQSYKKPPPPPCRKPLMTGAFMRPSLFNGPLPRLKPQPLKISMMIKSRLRKRESRAAKHRELLEYNDYMMKEAAFWRTLKVEKGWEGDDGVRDPRQVPWREGAWGKEIARGVGHYEALFQRDARRAASVFPKKMYDAVIAARRRKHAYYDARGKKRREAKAKEMEKEQSEMEQEVKSEDKPAS